MTLLVRILIVGLAAYWIGQRAAIPFAELAARLP